MSGLDNLQFVKPGDIEGRSFDMIEDGLRERYGNGPRPASLNPENVLVTKRVIHTTADFEFADTLFISPDAVKLGIDALVGGCDIVTDTTMAGSGINKRILGRFGGKVLNFIADPDVAEEARERGVTRSAVSMERAAALGRPLVYAIGNAPTALVRIWELLEAGEMVPPALIVAVPVGFVNVVESKELICDLDGDVAAGHLPVAVPRIVARGRKGGSTVAAAIVNALLYQASHNERD